MSNHIRNKDKIMKILYPQEQLSRKDLKVYCLASANMIEVIPAIKKKRIEEIKKNFSEIKLRS